MHYSYIFCILTYRTSSDLIPCLESICAKVSSNKIVIVNSYYDDTSEVNIQKIALQFDCDFYSIPNKGYSFGNNFGISKILDTYDFDYIVVANPDIVIEKFNDTKIIGLKGGVVAPIIKTLNGKNQNPYWAMKNSFAERMLYLGQKNRNRFLYLTGVLFNKIIREFFLFLFKFQRKSINRIYAAHGSCVFFHRDIFLKIGLFFDDNMFLMAEEAYISHVFEEANIPIFMTKDIVVRHKEDGTMDLSKVNSNETLRNSFIYYYEKTNDIKSIGEN